MPTGSPPPKNPKSKATETPPDVERGDHVYFRHAKGPRIGRVLARGADGFWVQDEEGDRHPVAWPHFLGHRTKVQADVQVIDRGEDGFLVEDEAKNRRYVHDPIGSSPKTEKLTKSLLPMVLLMGPSREDLMKALGNRPGLTLKPVTDKRGVQTKRWVRTNKPVPKVKGAAKAEPEAPKFNPGDKVTFEGGGGEIIGKPGRDGAFVKDAAGEKHKVLWSDMKAAGAGGGSGDGGDENFSGAEHFRKTDRADMTEDEALEGVAPETVKKMQEAHARIKHRIKEKGETRDRFKHGDNYLPDRKRLHDEIVAKVFTPEAIKRATPAPGEKPTFTMLGGRGGSGKSSLKGQVYDPNKAIVLDPDEIKAMLPEFEGWNAHEVHEESSDIADDIVKHARETGLNLVLDATMKTGETAIERIREFKNDGYRVEVHYMHAPRHVAVKRAVARYERSGRYVPPAVILGNKHNEENFDEARKHADAWSFHDNSGDKAYEVARGGNDTRKG